MISSRAVLLCCVAGSLFGVGSLIHSNGNEWAIPLEQQRSAVTPVFDAAVSEPADSFATVSYKMRSFFSETSFSAVSFRAAAKPADDLSPENVKRAIVRAQSFLSLQQKKDGTWDAGSYKTGATSLAILALLNSGLKPNHKAVAKGLVFIRKQPVPLTGHATYSASLMLMVLAAVNDKRDRPQMQRLAAALEAGQIKNGNDSGSWSYHLSGKGALNGLVARGDRSNAQFAILGLRDAVHAGIPVKRETWERARKNWTSQQNRDGSWGYTKGIKTPSGSMTVAGIASLVITARMLQTDNKNGKLDCCTEGNDKHLDAAIAWLGKRINGQNTVMRNPGMGGGSLFYYLYGLERAGRLSGQRFFGRYDWYRQGAEFFVKKFPNKKNGSWKGGGHGEDNPIVGTSLALLFLSKGLAPVLINKLKYGPPDRFNPDDVDDHNWARHPYDSRNLTDFISQQEKWPKLMAWQTVEMRKLVKLKGAGAQEALDQAKVLLITGSESPKTLLDKTRITILKDYIKRGGFIFIVGNCKAKSSFDSGVKQLIQKLFPEDKSVFKRLEASHAVYRSEYRLLRKGSEKNDWKDIELYGANYG